MQNGQKLKFEANGLKLVQMQPNDLLSVNGQPSDKRMPVLFVGHGNPMNAIEENEFSLLWKKIAETLPQPNAVLCISAHWETRGTYITAMINPKTIHDFGGFPEELYKVQYPASGSPKLADTAKTLVHSTSVGLDYRWGLDHGCWSVLRNFYPFADVPVVQMSIDYTKPFQYHFDLAAELKSLRGKGILIIGSGNIVHNLRLVDWYHPDNGFDWALEANDKFKKLISDENTNELIDIKNSGRAFQLSMPTPEHYLPLLYSVALKGKNENISFFNDKVIMGSLSMTSVLIGE